MNHIVGAFSSRIKREIQRSYDPNRQYPLYSFNYRNFINSIGQQYNVSYAIRQYKMSRMSSFYSIGYQDWYLGTVNDENFFIGGTIADGQSKYWSNI